MTAKTQIENLSVNVQVAFVRGFWMKIGIVVFVRRIFVINVMLKLKMVMNATRMM